MGCHDSQVDPSIARPGSLRDASRASPEAGGNATVRRTRAVVIALVFAWSLGGCLPTSLRPTGTPAASPTASSIPQLDLCEQLAAVLAERLALGDAFRAAIAGEFDDAALQARAIRDRLATLLEGLPENWLLTKQEASVRDTLELTASLLTATAATLDDPDRDVLDPVIVLREGETLLGALDLPPSDNFTRWCPGLSYPADPVAFPAPPSNAELGLPDTVGALVLDPHIGRTGGFMAELLEALGVNPAAVRSIDVWVPGGPDMQVYDHVRAPAAAVAEAIGSHFVPGAAKPTVREINGFTVFAYRQLTDEFTVHVAIRGDRVVVFRYNRNGVVRDFLEAMP
jgi:hypothetical protein